MARVIVQPIAKTISTFKQYTTPGTFNVQVSVNNAHLSGIANNSFTVVAAIPITGLTFNAAGGFCPLNLPCSIASSITTGSGVNYFWTVGNTTMNTTLTTITQTFTAIGLYPITLFAINLVSNQTYTLSIQVSDRITGLSFYAGLTSQSASVIGQNAMFLFSLTSGSRYTCVVDYGDSSGLVSFQDLPYNLNGTYIQHMYSENTEQMYTVSINCSNYLNSQMLSFNHHIQNVLSGLALIANGTTLNTAYSIDFMVSSGSTPYSVVCLIDGILDSGVSKDVTSVSPAIIYRG